MVVRVGFVDKDQQTEAQAMVAMAVGALELQNPVEEETVRNDCNKRSQKRETKKCRPAIPKIPPSRSDERRGQYV